jgi:hypothetical protein
MSLGEPPQYLVKKKRNQLLDTSYQVVSFAKQTKIEVVGFGVFDNLSAR